MASEDATKRLSSKKQTLDDAYAAPANFLEIDVINPITHGIGNKRYTDYEVRMKVGSLVRPLNETEGNSVSAVLADQLARVPREGIQRAQALQRL
jgi:hypothetical protein